MTDLLSQRPHRRRNALTGEWVTVSPQRAQRPWQGEEHPAPSSTGVTYDPDCYLCPGNTRANGNVNPPYTAPWAFDNDFPAVQADLDSGSAAVDGIDPGEPSALFRSEPVAGRCRVLCYHPDHSKTLADMTEQETLAVVQLWASEVGALRQSHQWVQVFENRGEMMGCSNAHPHGQIWAVDTLPNEGAKELAQQQAFFDAEGVALLEVYRAEEERLAERIVLQEEHWTVLVPYWAMWPFETLLLPRRRIDHLDALTESSNCLWHRCSPDCFAATTHCLIPAARTPWAGTVRRVARRRPIGSSMRIVIPPYCARRVCANTWWDMRC